MIVSGRLYLCDRCGCSCFSGFNDNDSICIEPDTYAERANSRRNAHDNNEDDPRDLPVSYERVYGMDLCQSCAKDFYKWLKYKQS